MPCRTTSQRITGEHSLTSYSGFGKQNGVFPIENNFKLVNDRQQLAPDDQKCLIGDMVKSWHSRKGLGEW